MSSACVDALIRSGVVLPMIGPASEREREDPPPFDPTFDPDDVVDADFELVAATDSIALTADDL